MYIYHKCQKHNKKRNPLLNLLINCISATSVPQILSINDDDTFRFLNFLIIGLCKYVANYWCDIVLFSAEPPEVLELVNLLARVAEASLSKNL